MKLGDLIIPYDDLKKLRDENAQLRAALKPFAELAPAFLGVTEGYINVGTRNQVPLQAFADAHAALFHPGNLRVDRSGG